MSASERSMLQTVCDAYRPNIQRTCATQMPSLRRADQCLGATRTSERCEQGLLGVAGNQLYRGSSVDR